RKIKFSFIGLLFIILASNSFAEVDLTNLVKKIQPAVVTVMTFDKNKKPLGQGSGFFIDANGLLVTNYHVLKGAYHAVVKTYDGKKYPVKYVVSKNKYMDLIKVLVDLPKSSFRWINLTSNLPSIAERVVVVGSPMGLELTVSEGIVSAVRQIPDVGKILQISAPISSGSSGSPVVNMRGQVVGVVSFYLAKGQSLNFAVPSQYLINLKPAKTPETLSEWTYVVDRDGRFEKDNSGVVHDTKTGLEWYAGPDKDMSWNQARSWVASLSVAGGGWRMPTRKELGALYQKGAGTKNKTPLLKTTGWWVWSGETKSSSSAWGFFFGSGYENWYGRYASTSYRSFAVRSRR
ncbi:MAG: trypsin-like peptidase domain-containing protein, partial [Desulfobacterales bacterium]|nr:trypsin-like peptidase domain-containing protein [Desulfobacterales bacterium]